MANRQQILADLENWKSHKFFEYKILESIPHIFQGDLDAYLYWKNILSSKLEVDTGALVMVGSACVGVSLNPNKSFKDFDPDSDVDVAVISQYHFDVAWRRIRNVGAEYHGFTPVIKASLKDHSERLVYWGTIATDKILSILPYSHEWTKARSAGASMGPTIGRAINMRIYRDFESLRSYQINGIKNAQSLLLEQ